MLPLGKIRQLLQKHGLVVTNNLLENLIILMTQFEETIRVGTISTIAEIGLIIPTLLLLKDALGFNLFNEKKVILELEINLTFQDEFLVIYNISTSNNSVTIRSGRKILSYEEMAVLLFTYFLTSLDFEEFTYTFNPTTEQERELNKLNNSAYEFYQFLKPNP